MENELCQLILQSLSETSPLFKKGSFSVPQTFLYIVNREALKQNYYYYIQEAKKNNVTYFLISAKIFAWIAASPVESVLSCFCPE